MGKIANYISDKFNIQNIKQLIQLNSKKKRLKKWAEDLNNIFQHIHRKIPNIFFFFFGHGVQLDVGSQFSDQGLNLGRSSESAKS